MHLLARLLRRSWLYFRTGFSIYISLPLGAAQFLVTTYYLFIKEMPSLAFLHLWLYTLVSIPIGLLASVLAGYIHYKGIGAFQAEQDISVESNPYNYKLVPGVSREVSIPATLLSLRVLQKIAERDDLLSKEEKSAFSQLTNKIERLLEGESIGAPKQWLRPLRRTAGKQTAQ